MGVSDTRSWQRDVGRIVASVAISLLLLIATYHLMDDAGSRASMLRQLAGLKWHWLAAAVLAALANNVVASIRFLVIIRDAAAVHLPFWTVQKVNAAALFLGYWTPVSIAGDGGRMVWLRNGIVDDYRRAFVIVLWDRIIALLALLAFMLPFVPAYVTRAATSTSRRGSSASSRSSHWRRALRWSGIGRFAGASPAPSGPTRPASRCMRCSARFTC